MAKLEFKDKVLLGHYMLFATRDAAERQRLQNPGYARDKFAEHLIVPEGDTIVLHFDEPRAHHILIPLGSDVQTLVDAINNGESPYPNDYVDEPLRNISVENEPVKALEFRIGEYTMSRCKT